MTSWQPPCAVSSYTPVLIVEFLQPVWLSSLDAEESHRGVGLYPINRIFVMLNFAHNVKTIILLALG